jgi:hypothetical protein
MQFKAKEVDIILRMDRELRKTDSQAMRDLTHDMWRKKHFARLTCAGQSGEVGANVKGLNAECTSQR